jgi:hypothetical protein
VSGVIIIIIRANALFWPQDNIFESGVFRSKIPYLREVILVGIKIKIIKLKETIQMLKSISSLFVAAVCLALSISSADACGCVATANQGDSCWLIA